MMRLQVALSRAGCASRRKSATIIKDGKVKVNGKVITEPGFRVDVSKDKIIYSGKAVTFQKNVYILLNKPCGVITSTFDTRQRKTVFDLIPKSPYRLYHVGRLDKRSSGLLLLTNDGELAFRLTHPKFEIKREYEVMIKGELTEIDRVRLTKGVYLEGKRTAPCEIHILKKSINKAILRIRLHEGRKRQIRKMFEKLGYPVFQLKRIRFGPLELGGLKIGTHKVLSKREVESLKKAVGLT